MFDVHAGNHLMVGRSSKCQQTGRRKFGLTTTLGGPEPFAASWRSRLDAVSGRTKG